MKILDATCGFKGIWFQKNHPLVTFMDKRNGKYYFITPSGKKKCTKVNPDIVSEWKDAPFPDNYFDIVLASHVLEHVEDDRKAMREVHRILKPDGILLLTTPYETWEQELKVGIKKLFKILKPEGTFILKWNECNKPINKIIKLFPYQPLFGTRTGLNNKNIWLVFLKYDVNDKLDNWEIERNRKQELFTGGY